MVNYPNYEAVRTIVKHWETSHQEHHLRQFYPQLEATYRKMAAVVQEIRAKMPEDPITREVVDDHQRVAEVLNQARGLLGMPGVVD